MPSSAGMLKSILGMDALECGVPLPLQEGDVPLQLLGFSLYFLAFLLPLSFRATTCSFTKLRIEALLMLYIALNSFHLDQSMLSSV